MQAVATAELMPGCCVFCQSGQGPFVDTFRDDDDPRIVAGPDQVQFGNICHWYICARCVSSMMQLVAPALGQMVVRDNLLTEMGREAIEHEATIAALEAKVEELSGALRVVNALTAPEPAAPESPAPDSSARVAHPAGKGRRRVNEQ